MFHDDQHGTAIITAAAVLNGLRVVGKDIEHATLVCSGAGAAAIACLNLLVALGMKRENITVCDSKGVIFQTREDKERMDESKKHYAIADNGQRVLADAVPGKDIFLGLSGPNVLSPEMLKGMNEHPIVLALANPQPEIWPPEAKAARPDVIIGTGRSDFPNQVNNVLCFPFIFRGALDVGATTINEEMKLACVRALADLAMAEQSDVVMGAYGDADLHFGPEYLIPKPFDPRLMMKIAPAVAEAAAASGVAQRPIADLDAYRDKLQTFVYASGTTMKPIIDAARNASRKRVAYAEGEDERVLRAAQIVVDDGIARPTLIGRPAIIAQRIEKFGLRLTEGVDYDVVNVEHDDRYKGFWQTYHELTKRRGITVPIAKIEMRRRLSLIGAMLLHHGDVDGLICGTWGTNQMHLTYIDQVIGKKPGARTYAAMMVMSASCSAYLNGVVDSALMLGDKQAKAQFGETFTERALSSRAGERVKKSHKRYCGERMPDPARLELVANKNNPDARAIVSAWEGSGRFKDVPAEIGRTPGEIKVSATIVRPPAGKKETQR